MLVHTTIGAAWSAASWVLSPFEKRFCDLTLSAQTRHVGRMVHPAQDRERFALYVP